VTAYLRQLIRDFIRAAFWGKKLFDFAWKYTVLAIPWLFGIASDSTVRIGDFECRLGFAVGVILFVVWIVGAFCYVCGRCPHAALRFGAEVVETSTDGRVRIYNDGFGNPEVSAWVTKIINERGESRCDAPFEIAWTNDDKGGITRPRISQDVPAAAKLISKDVWLPHKKVSPVIAKIVGAGTTCQLSDSNRPDNLKHWIEVTVTDENGKGWRRWFVFEPLKPSEERSFRCLAVAGPPKQPVASGS